MGMYIKTKRLGMVGTNDELAVSERKGAMAFNMGNATVAAAPLRAVRREIGFLITRTFSTRFKF